MDDKYKRPKTTFQDNLSNDEIKELLKDYIPVDDVPELPLNSHVRYFTKKNGKKVFRMGGNVTKIEPKKGYLVLSNGKLTWSVQLKDSLFFRKLDVSEVRKSYEKKISKYKNKIKKLEESLQEIKKKLSRK